VAAAAFLAAVLWAGVAVLELPPALERIRTNAITRTATTATTAAVKRAGDRLLVV
jgi:hypothetical protein